MTVVPVRNILRAIWWRGIALPYFPSAVWFEVESR